MEYEAVVGLEIHAQLLTESKIFCGCSAAFGAEPNAHTCPVCIGLPGTLPVLNRKVVELAVRAALALGGTIAGRSVFARKNYFYPDLPKGYQISQYDQPLALGGSLDVEVRGVERRVGITRVHLEEDAGKLVYTGAIESADTGNVDLNRAGVPLVEIVTEPDIRSPEEAGLFLRRLRDMLRALGVCDGNMEQGSLRCDANVSLRPRGAVEFGVKTELKNMNSFRFVEQALAYEIRRQSQVLEEGGRVIQETRLWDEVNGVTRSMRGKEEAHDYRYFPDPDLVAVRVDAQWVEAIRLALPELPGPREKRFVADYGLPREDAGILAAAADLAGYFERAVALFPHPRKVANWILTELMQERRREEPGVEHEHPFPVSPERLADMLAMIEEGVISGKIGKQVLDEMIHTGKEPRDVVREKGLVQIRDSSELDRVIDGVLAAHPGEVDAFRAGKEKVIGFLMGQVMRRTQGKADPQRAQDIMRHKLKGS